MLFVSLKNLMLISLFEKFTPQSVNSIYPYIANIKSRTLPQILLDYYHIFGVLDMLHCHISPFCYTKFQHIKI